MKLVLNNFKHSKELIVSNRTYYTDADIIQTQYNYVLFTGQLLDINSISYKQYINSIATISRSAYEFIEYIEKDKLNGEWAIIYIDKIDEKIYLFTDPLGTIPIYFNSNHEISTNNLEISSCDEFDFVYKSEVLKWGYNTDNRTPWKDVKRVMPNRLTKLISINKKNTYIEMPIFDEMFVRNVSTDKNIRDILHNAVLKQLETTDISQNIAVLLSGGLDSSIIAYELLNINKCIYNNSLKLKFYTLDEDPMDVECTKEFCKMYNIETQFITYDKSNVNYENALLINKTPIDLGSMVPNQILFSKIPEKIYFTGDGADCLLGGFRRIDEYDSQLSDVFEEHPFYYSPKGNNAGEYFGTHLKCAFNDFDLISYAFKLPLEERTHKKCLKEAYKDVLPDCIINRKKLPLKTKQIVEDKNQYRYNLAKIFYNMNWKNLKDKE